MIWKRLLRKMNRRKILQVREEEAVEREFRASEMIRGLQRRKEDVEDYLIPRQRRNHWQEGIATMIHSGRT